LFSLEYYIENGTRAVCNGSRMFVKVEFANSIGSYKRPQAALLRSEFYKYRLKLHMLCMLNSNQRGCKLHLGQLLRKFVT